MADPRPGITFNYVPVDQRTLDRALNIKAVCDAHNVDLKAAAIQFPLAHPVIPCVLTGVRSAEELEENIRLFETKIPDALWPDLIVEGLLSKEAAIPANETEAGSVRSAVAASQ